MATNTKELSPTARNGQVKSNTQMNRSLIEISADLQKPVPPRMLKKKKVETKKGGYYELSYLPWYRAVRIMDFYCPGWEYEITDKTITTKDCNAYCSRLDQRKGREIFQGSHWNRESKYRGLWRPNKQRRVNGTPARMCQMGTRIRPLRKGRLTT